MKKLLMALCLLLTSNAFALKMGKVDVQKILVTVKESASIREKLKKEFDKKQKEIRDEEQKIVKEQEDFKKKAALLNDKKKAEKAQELQQRVMTLQNKMRKYQSEMQKMENKFKAPVLKKINEIVGVVSKKKGFDFTYEASTTPFLYAKSVTDITDEVIKEYDKKNK